MVVSLDETTLKLLHHALEEDFAEVVVLYFEKAPELLNKMRTFFLDGDYLKAANAAHTLKGSSSNLGVARLVALCLELDDLLRNGGDISASQFSALYEDAVSEYANAHDLLKAYCHRAAVNLA